MLYNLLKFRWKMEAVVIYLTNTPASEVPAIHRSTLPPNMIRFSDLLLHDLQLQELFYVGLSAVAPSPLDRPSLCQIGRVRRTQAVVAALSQREYLASSSVDSQLNVLGQSKHM